MGFEVIFYLLTLVVKKFYNQGKYLNNYPKTLKPLNAYKKTYSQCPKSEHVRFSDKSLLSHFQSVRYSGTVQNPNKKVPFLDVFERLKAELVKDKWDKIFRILNVFSLVFGHISWTF